MCSYVKANSKPSTYATKKTILRAAIVPFFGKMRLDEIGPREIERFKSKMLEPRAQGEVGQQLSNLRSCRPHAQLGGRVGHLAHIPPVKWLKCPSRSSTSSTSTRRSDSIRGADERVGAMISSALKTGLRLGELLGAALGGRRSRRGAARGPAVGRARDRRHAEERQVARDAAQR